jgi:outer membrane protein TolC
MARGRIFPGAIALLFCMATCTGNAGAAPGQAEAPRRLTLQQCLDTALENNRWRPASQFSVEIAEAQLRQALSSYWPEVAARAVFTRMDENLNFVFPQTSVAVPASTVVANTPLGPLPVAVPAQEFAVPEQDIKLMDRDNLLGSLDATLPLYTGGLRPAVVRQARSGVEAARQEARRTELQIVYDVKRIYWGAVLAQRLRELADDALARMEVTLELTERLYQGGSMRVKKTDYLRNKTVVEALRSAVAHLRSNEELTLAALVNALGLDWNTPIAVAEREVPFHPYGADLPALVADAYEFNPDWARLEEGLKAAEAGVDAKQAGYLPRVALLGNVTAIVNDYDKGVVTPENRNAWAVGLAIELPLFRGFRTRGEVQEARARLGRLKEQRVLLRQGLALQVKDVFLQMTRALAQEGAMSAAARAAEENRDLHERAYQEELVETKDVIEAQLVESLMKANYEKTRYDHVEAQARLDFVVGSEITAVLRVRP